MSFTYGFYDSINHDRTYNARQMSEIFDGIINDGVFESIGSKFMVSAVSGMQIKVGSGRAWFNHTWTNNDSDMPLTLDAAEPLYKRIDAIILEVNENQDTRENSIKIIKGTPASTPSKPTLINTDGIHQHILGWITINGGATAITQANIENAIGTSATPYVTAILQVTNVDQLLAQWDAQFGEWFRNIQAQMEGDVATHLQQQISAINAEQTSSGVYYNRNTSEPYDVLKSKSGTPLRMPEGWKIGDIRKTSITNPGPSWALCNGQQVTTPYKYEDSLRQLRSLNYSLYEDFESDIFWTEQSSGWILTNENAFFVNDKYVVFRGVQTPTPYKLYVIFVSKDSEEPTVALTNGIPATYVNSDVNISDNNYGLIWDGERYIFWSCGKTIINTNAQVSHTFYESTDLINWTPFTVTITPNASFTTEYRYVTGLIRLENGKYAMVYSWYDSDGENHTKPVQPAFADSRFGPFVYEYGESNLQPSSFCSMVSGYGKKTYTARYELSSIGNYLYMTYYTYSSNSLLYRVKKFDSISKTCDLVSELSNITSSTSYGPDIVPVIHEGNLCAVVIYNTIFISRNGGSTWTNVNAKGVYSPYRFTRFQFFDYFGHRSLLYMGNGMSYNNICYYDIEDGIFGSVQIQDVSTSSCIHIYADGFYSWTDKPTKQSSTSIYDHKITTKFSDDLSVITVPTITDETGLYSYIRVDND